jgi:MYXO-CTERM domain-containing protein
VATLTVNSAPVPPSSSGGGGGGAMEGWFVMALAFLALVRARRFRPVPLPGRPNFRCLSI